MHQFLFFFFFFSGAQSQLLVDPTCQHWSASLLASFNHINLHLSYCGCYSAVSPILKGKNAFCCYCRAQHELCEHWIRILSVNLSLCCTGALFNLLLGSKCSMRAENDLSFSMHKLITHAQFIHASITYLWHLEYARALEVIFFLSLRGAFFFAAGKKKRLQLQPIIR